MADPTIVVYGTANFTQLNRGLAQADARVDGSTSKWSKLGKAVKIASTGAIAGAGALAAASFKLAQGAAEDEKSQVRLATALRNNTGARDQDIASIEAWISAQGRALGVADDELRPAIGRLAAATRDQGEAQKLTSLAVNIAKGSETSLASVVKALAKARNGSTAALARYGIKTKESTKDTAALKSAELAAASAQDAYNTALREHGASSKEARTAAARLEIAQIKLGEAQKKTKTETIDFDEAVRRLSKTYRGQAAKAAETTAGKYERLKLTLDELGESVGARLLPLGNKLADTLLKKAVPAADSLWAALERNGIDGVADEFERLTGINIAPYLDDLERAGDGALRIVKALGPSFADAARELPPILQPLNLVADVLGILADVAEAIPAPLKSIGIQAALAALILPRLAAGASAVGTSLLVAGTRAIGFTQAVTTAGTRSQALAGALTRAGGAARTAAGIGGLLALSQSAQTADRTTSTLLGTIGGAATGFSLGGPWGALIGGAAGAALGLFSKKAKEANKAAEDGEQKMLSLAASLDQLTGATTESTRAIILKSLTESGAIKTLNGYGLSARTAVNAALGQKDASAQVQQALAAEAESITTLKFQLGALNSARGGPEVDEAREQLEKEIDAREKAARAVGEQTVQVRKLITDRKEETAATRDYSGLLSGIPADVKTDVRANGLEPTLGAVKDLARRYGIIDRKQIKTLISAAGLTPTSKGIDKILEGIEKVGTTRVNLSAYQQSVNRGLNDVGEVARRGGGKIRENIEKPVAKTKINLSGVAPAVRSGLTPAQTAARSGAVSIGANVKAGFPAGFAGADFLWSGQVRAAVNSAIDAGAAAAAVRSPSRKTMYIGDMMGKGFVVGMGRQKPAVAKAGRSVAEAALAGITNGSTGIGAALDRVTRLVEKQVKLKDPKKERAREQEILRGLKSQTDALRANGKAQDRNNAALKAARDRYRDLVRESRAYAASIKDSFVSSGNVVGLGQLEDGSVTTKGLLDQLKDRVAVAERFAKLIRSFRDGTGPKLNQTTIQQLLDAGPEASIATAEAIAAGGDAAVREINSLTSQLGQAGGSLGNTLAKQFKGAGIQAAAGLVQGLEQEQAKLDQAAVRIGAKIVRAIRQQLGIKSPSRVFRGVGEQSMAGLALGLDETYARTLGANVGRGVKAGVGRVDLADAARLRRERLALAFDGSGAAAAPLRVQVKLTAEEATGLQRGRGVTADLSIANGYGFRTLS